MPEVKGMVPVARRNGKLWRVLVMGGMALAMACAGCAGQQKTGSQGTGSGGTSSGTDKGGDTSGGGGSGASGW